MMKFSSKSWGTTKLKISIKQPYVNLCICDPSNMAVKQISRLLLNKELFFNNSYKIFSHRRQKCHSNY